MQGYSKEHEAEEALIDDFLKETLKNTEEQIINQNVLEFNFLQDFGGGGRDFIVWNTSIR